MHGCSASSLSGFRMDPMSIDRDFTLTTLRDLIRIDSRNPGLEVGAPGEWEIARHVSSPLGELGWEAECRDLGNRRTNVVARPGNWVPGIIK